ncbi:hypothetical protein ES705_15025 [subsurface metagenome]
MTKMVISETVKKEVIQIIEEYDELVYGYLNCSWICRNLQYIYKSKSTTTKLQCLTNPII